MATPFEILGVSVDSSLEEIKQQYREKLLGAHPDKWHRQQQRNNATNADQIGSTKKLRQEEQVPSVESIKSAYHVLSDPLRKEEYLKSLATKLQKQGMHSSGDGLDEFSLDDFSMVERAESPDELVDWFMDCPRCTNKNGFHVTEDILEQNGEELPNGMGYQVIIQCSMCSLWIKLNYDFADN
ncbi:hypothetical protein ACO0RG_001736 [Hanseniaspora osmophila]|uniref:Diphthamide biosynthesis protein 4 n=1 Tax=Hanseniaspora osmophila TaxID=56408 RepID=A0A1E5RGF3_9ASCO|nr:Diphthamide biosynthesis protein 4 [Hanseniaspora osmophila]